MHSNFLEEMKIKEVIGALERFAPLPLQDGFDNAGLQIGLTEAEATGALLCLDVTEAVVDEAVTLGYNLIVSHHPLIFKGYKSITGRDYVERCILKAIRNDIAIYSAHTNLDNAPGGVNFKIAEKIGLPLCPSTVETGKLGISSYFISYFSVISPARLPSPVPRIIAVSGCVCILPFR